MHAARKDVKQQTLSRLLQKNRFIEREIIEDEATENLAIKEVGFTKIKFLFFKEMK